jgi:hypothetical protein
MSDYIDGDALVGDTDPELVSVKIPVPDGFATGEDNFSSGFAIVGESYPDLPNYPNSIALRTNNASGSTEINWTAHVPDNTSITVVDPYNIVCSGGGLSWFNVSDPATYSVPSSLHGWWQIVQAVAETDSTYTVGVDFDDVPLERACPYCPAKMPYRLHDEPFPHDQNCIVIKARAMVEAMPHEVKE